LDFLLIALIKKRFCAFFVLLACLLPIFLNDSIDAILQSHCENFATAFATHYPYVATAH
jgi:hypothetical protein